jgi:rhamnogalacturonan endolyase
VSTYSWSIARFSDRDCLLTLHNFRYYHSSSCAVRSGVTCYHVSNKWTFPTSYLHAGKNTTNEIILSLPFNATDYESALLPRSIYVQYDALRLEVK